MAFENWKWGCMTKHNWVEMFPANISNNLPKNILAKYFYSRKKKFVDPPSTRYNTNPYFLYYSWSPLLSVSLPL